MRQPIRLLLLVLLPIVGPAAPLFADDSDIFLVDAVEPNVVILLDTSGSMNDPIGDQPKIDIARGVVNNLLTNVGGVRFGVFRFQPNAGEIVGEVASDIPTMITKINAITPNGYTPLGQATYDIQEYYEGLLSEAGGDSGVPVTYPSPIQYWCQLNYVILVTDGMPTGEAETLVAEAATSLYTTDHSTTLPGVQNVIVHTVGFAVPEGTALLTQTAANGGGSFYTADDAASLEQALADAISQVIADSYSFSQPMIPSTGVSGGDRAYFASFTPEAVRPFWDGHLQAHDRDANGQLIVDGLGELGSTAVWDAGTLLAARAATTRTIYTTVGSSREAFTRANASITRDLLGVGSSSERDDVIDFIRGIDSYDADLDGNTTEERAWKLGDVFHSAPVLVFPPPLRLPDPSYSAFKAANLGRTTALLVGANDGMLHAFRASDGHELWGYIPQDLLADLQNLTQRIGEHAFYVDGNPVVADVKTGGTWKTIVVFGERRGGNSYHALDITDTTNPLYLWSFTDAELGESWSEPAIGRVQMADGTERWVAFVGAGYDTASNNASGRGVFAIDLATGTKLWQYLGGGLADSQHMNFSIPAKPMAADLNGDGYIDRVYVGDVGGQLWKFDTSALATVSGGLISNWPGKRLFAAAPAQANPPAAGEYHAPQAFYGTPLLAYDENRELWVFLGSGDRNHPKDSSANHFFGIKDDTTMANGSTLTAADLVDATAGGSISQGWYYPLPADEKVLATADVFNNVIYFTTYRPETVDVCDATTGRSRLYALRMADGLPGVDWTTGEPLSSPDGSEPPSTDAGDGLPSEPEVVLGGTEDAVVVGTTDGDITQIAMPPTRTKQLRYWREVL